MIKPEHSHTSSIIEINGQKLFYEVSGAGQPLILMHGWGCTHETVRSIANAASQTHTVYNIDFPGFGQSPEPDTIWGVEEYNTLIEGFVKQNKINNPVLIGHSFGGRVAILYASRNKVEKVILVDAAGVKPSRSLKYYAKVYFFKTLKKLLHLCVPQKRAAKIIERLRTKIGSKDYASSSPKMKDVLNKVVNEDLKYAMPNIKAPTLLIWGELDKATPIKDAKIMENLIPDSGLVVFAGAGHYSFLDEPKRFATVLSTFLKS